MLTVAATIPDAATRDQFAKENKFAKGDELVKGNELVKGDELANRNAELERHLAIARSERDVAQREKERVKKDAAARFTKHAEEYTKQLSEAKAECDRLQAQLVETHRAHTKELESLAAASQRELVKQQKLAVAQLARTTTEYQQLLATEVSANTWTERVSDIIAALERRAALKKTSP
jgi:hypothetical protein